MPIVTALSVVAIFVSILALGVQISNLLEWRQTEKKLRKLREGK